MCESFGNLSGWEIFASDLEMISWVPKIHEEPGKAHWIVAMMTQDTS
jgi:hypothetical protein